MTHQNARDRDFLDLTNAVCAIGGLVLNGRVPPRIEMKDIRRPRQIQSLTARLQAKQKNGRGFSFLKALDQMLAFA